MWGIPTGGYPMNFGIWLVPLRLVLSVWLITDRDGLRLDGL